MSEYTSRAHEMRLEHLSADVFEMMLANMKTAKEKADIDARLSEAAHVTPVKEVTAVKFEEIPSPTREANATVKSLGSVPESRLVLFLSAAGYNKETDRVFMADGVASVYRKIAEMDLNNANDK
jgi:hypothetical protein